MEDYSTKTCEACNADAPKASEGSLSNFLTKYSDWSMSNDVEFPQITRVYKFSKYTLGLEFVNLVAELSDAEGHHPDIILEYGKVTVKWWSHKIQNLHENDFIMAAKCDLIYDNSSTV